MKEKVIEQLKQRCDGWKSVVRLRRAAMDEAQKEINILNNCIREVDDVITEAARADLEAPDGDVAPPSLRDGPIYRDPNDGCPF